MRASEGYSGKVFLVSGLQEEVPEFKGRMSKFSYDAAQSHSFINNKKECLRG